MKSVTDARRTIDAFETAFNWLAPAILCAILFIAGCQKEKMQPDSDTKAFSKYIQLRNPAQSVRFEIATLPESNGGSVPGPTDYVALVGAATLSQADGQTIAQQPPYSYRKTIPKEFIRNWLERSQKISLENVFFKSNGTAYDITHLASRPAKRAVAIPAGDNQWLFYLEYVSP